MNTKPTSDCPAFPLSSVSLVFTYDWQYLIHLLCKYYVLCTLLAGTTIYLSWRYSIHYLCFIHLTYQYVVDSKIFLYKNVQCLKGGHVLFMLLFFAYVYSAVKYLFCYVFFAHNDAKYVLSI